VRPNRFEENVAPSGASEIPDGISLSANRITKKMNLGVFRGRHTDD
jgi:hypothetical protein